MNSKLLALILFCTTLFMWAGFHQEITSGFTLYSPAAEAPATVPMAPCTNPVTAPYFESFDTNQTYVSPYCWAEGLRGGFSNNATVIGYDAYSGPNSLGLFNDFSDTTMAISPQLSALSLMDKQVSFFAKANDTANRLYIGTLPNETSLGQFSPIDTITFESSSVFREYVVTLDSGSGYNGTDSYIAFFHSNNSPFSSIIIDEFRYDTTPPCARPINPAFIAVNDTSVTVQSTSSGTVFNYAWGPKGFNQASTSALIDSGSGGNPYTINGLQSSTTYHLYIQNDCSGSSAGVSSWNGPFTFRTDCSPFTAPYFNNFDQDTLWGPPLCWKNLLRGSGSNEILVYNRTNSSFSAPNQIRMSKSGNTSAGNYTMLVTPAFSDLSTGDKQVRFLTSAISDDVSLIVGTMSDPRDPATFSAVDSIFLPSTSLNLSNPTYAEYIVELTTANGYNGQDNFIGLMSSRYDGAYAYIYIDNFQYEVIPPCSPASTTSLGITAVTSTSARATWSSGAGLKTIVEWGSNGFTPGNNFSGRASTTLATLTMPNLSSNTTYDYYLQDSCAAGKSYYVGPFTFTTACNPMIAPYQDNLDGTTWGMGSGFSNENDTIDNCWSRDPVSNSEYRWAVFTGPGPGLNTGPASDHSGNGNYLLTNGTAGSTGDTAAIYSPLVNISGLTEPYFEFYYHRFGSNMGDLIVQLDSGTGVWHTLLTLTGSAQSSSSDPYKSSGANINTLADTIQVRVLAIRKSCCEGDMAIDNLSFGEAPSCPDINNITHGNIADTTATVYWTTDSKASAYQVWHGPTGFYQGSTTSANVGTITTVNQDSLVVDTLQPNTCYQYLVRSLCGPADSSRWQGPYNFCTPCNPFTAPYSNGFETGSPASTPSCWSSIISDQGSVVIDASTPQAGSQHLKIYNDYFPGEIIAVSPQFSDMTSGTKEVRFHARSASPANEQLIVGTLSDATDYTTFTAIDTFTLSNAYQIYSSAINAANGYNGTDLHIGLKHADLNSFEAIFVDNFNYNEASTCPAPGGFAIINTTDSTATVGWNTSVGAQYEIEYGLKGFARGTGTIVNPTGNSAVISLIPGNIPNHIYIRARCGTTDSSYWVGPIAVNTPPVPCDDFEAYDLGMFEGQSTLFQSDQFFDETVVSTTKANSGNKSLYFFPLSTNGAAQTIAHIEVDTSSMAEVSFYINVTPQAGAYVALHSDVANFEIAFDLKFDPNGTVSATDASFFIPTQFASFTYTQGQWIKMSAIIDFAADSTWLMMNGQDMNAGWQYSRGGAVSKNLDGVEFATFVAFGQTADFYMDDFCVSLYDPSACAKPDSVNLSALDCDSLSLNWNSYSGGSIIEYGTQGFAPGSGTLTSVETSPLTLGNLQANTFYDVYIADTCSGDTSAFAGPFTVSTDSVPLPQISYTASSSYGTGNMKVFFDASASMGSQFKWTFGNGDSATTDTATAIYTTNQSYTVHLQVENACGTVDSSFTVIADIGMDEWLNPGTFEVYPNPSEGTFYLRHHRGEQSQLEVRVYTTTGKLILQLDHSSFNSDKEIPLDLNRFSNGLYLLHITTPDGVSTIPIHKN